jgi:hypothetical protein
VSVVEFVVKEKQMEEIVYDSSLKQAFCFLCKTPPLFSKCGFYPIRENELWVCMDCLENKTALEKIKTNDQNLYYEIVEKIETIKKSPYFSKTIEDFKAFDRIESYAENGKTKHSIKKDDEIGFDQVIIINGCSQWLTKLSIDELRSKAKEYCKPDPPKGIEIQGVPIYKNKDAMELDGEIFRTHPDYVNIQVSNFGRIKNSNNEILEQYDPDEDDKWKCGYLKVKIKGIRKPEIEKLVYKLVGETWLKKPVNNWYPSDNAYNYNIIHHITNNGYDNRVENLIRVTKWQHKMIHTYLKINDLTISELFCLILSYKQINIMEDDYRRILTIAKRGYQLESDEGKSSWVDDFIVPVEEYIKYHFNK